MVLKVNLIVFLIVKGAFCNLSNLRDIFVIHARPEVTYRKYNMGVLNVNFVIKRVKC